MQCHVCESVARAVCKFCGRAVCEKHFKKAEFFSGFGQKQRGEAFGVLSGSDTAVTVRDAIWCGHCKIEYQRTY